MRIFLILLLTALAACEKKDTPASPVKASARLKAVLSPTGYGPIKFGARLDDIEKAIGPRLDPERPLDPGCGYVRFKTLPGVRFMVEGGIITRADAEYNDSRPTSGCTARDGNPGRLTLRGP